MNKNLKVKIIRGFRKDQEISIDLEEAHKAYYLFLNPDTRTTFKNGVAIRGQDITGIIPDYAGSMGWNPEHLIQVEDMTEIRQLGIENKLQDEMYIAKQIAHNVGENALNLPLSEAKTLMLGDTSQKKIESKSQSEDDVEMTPEQKEKILKKMDEISQKWVQK